MRKKRTILEWADEFPPFVVRLLARANHGHAPKTNLEISRASGLPRSTVGQLSGMTSWAGVQLDVLDRFCRGCGVDLLRMRRHREYLRRMKWSHVNHIAPQQTKFYHRLLNLRRDNLESRGGPAFA